MLEKILRTTEKFIPKPIFRFFQPAYHLALALVGGLLYRFPGRHLKVITVTGTKGKTSTIELISAILEEAGYKTAIVSTLRLKVGQKEERNLFKMTMPGRFFIQKTLRKAVGEKCEFAIIETTSEGARFFRHLFIAPNALVFTNLSPEHIESHGSYEKYKEAKFSIAKELERSWKRPRAIIVNADDPHGKDFLNIKVEEKRTFSLASVRPHEILPDGISFTFSGKKIKSNLRGEFNLYNILASVETTRAFGISDEKIIRAIQKFKGIRGRLEEIKEGQNFSIVVDYAHTADSMEKVYQVYQNQKKICVFGATGGGRDKWKRPEMGKVADNYCDSIILTDDDPYDDNREEIVRDIKEGITEHEPKVILNRREAIREALKEARVGDAVIITGKGTDPFIMGSKGSKEPWDDATVAREELTKII